MQIVQTHEATADYKDAHGQRYHIDSIIERQGRSAIVRSAWIIKPTEDFPRLVTCYPLEEVDE